MLKAIIFDFDGTLTELTLNFPLLRSEVEAIAMRYTAPATIETLDGYYIIEMIYELERRIGSRGEVFVKEAFDKLRSLEVESAVGKDVYPYTRLVLGSLRAKGVRTGIITRTCIEVVRQVFPDVDEYVEAVVTRDDMRLVKPHPAQVEEVMRILHVTPGEAMLVGDHPTDVSAGKAAGLITAGVLAGRTTREALEAEGATYILTDIRDILHLDVIPP
jgi:phosphoglycolate phosphatase